MQIMWERTPLTLSTDTEDMELSVRAGNVLKNANIDKVWQLVQCTEYGLLLLPNCGRHTVNELKECLGRDGFHLGSDPLGPELIGSLIRDPNDQKYVWRLVNKANTRRRIADAEFVSGDYS